MKQTGKLSLIMVAVVALGIFALPSVMSVGTGQHTFVNGSQLNCNKCHANANDGVNNELKASTLTMYSGVVKGTTYAQGVKIHAMDNTGTVGQCKDCHEAASVRTSPDDAGDHTNIKLRPNCTGCHTNVDAELTAGAGHTGTTDAHARLNSVAAGNAGCMGCHTAVYVGGQPSYSYSSRSESAAGVNATFNNLYGLTVGNNTATTTGTTPWTP